MVDVSRDYPFSPCGMRPLRTCDKHVCLIVSLCLAGSIRAIETDVHRHESVRVTEM